MKKISKRKKNKKFDLKKFNVNKLELKKCNLRGFEVMAVVIFVVAAMFSSFTRAENVPDNLEELINTLSEMNMEAERVADELKGYFELADYIAEHSIDHGEDLSSIDLIDHHKQAAINDINKTIIENASYIEAQNLESFEARLASEINEINNHLIGRLDDESDLDIFKIDIKNTLAGFNEFLEPKRTFLMENRGLEIYKDSDGDKLSDFDEISFFGTDPNNAFTVAGELNDFEKILEGIDPLSETGEEIQVDDPREDNNSIITEVYNINKGYYKPQNGGSLLNMGGIGFPNSISKLFFYSSPIQVSLKTDASGNWKYEFEEELENGDHLAYVATIDRSGRIIASSEPIAFTKTAEAIEFDEGAIRPNTGVFNGGKNFWLILLLILIVMVIITIAISGDKRLSVQRVKRRNGDQ